MSDEIHHCAVCNTPWLLAPDAVNCPLCGLSLIAAGVKAMVDSAILHLSPDNTNCMPMSPGVDPDDDDFDPTRWN